MTIAHLKKNIAHPGLPALYLLAYLGLVFYFLEDYFVGDYNVYMALIMSPYIILHRKGEYSYRYLSPALFFMLLALFIPVKTCFYMALVFGLLLLLETSIGKTGYFSIFLLIVLSPIFRYFSNLFGFPIRMWLTELTGKLLNLAGKNVETAGNVIRTDGSEFSVDIACAGLNMLSTSLVIALFLMAYHQRKCVQQFSFKIVAALLSLTVLLNIICNLIRIILLIIFRIMPGNFMHDVTGIICLAVYVVIPLILISNKIFRPALNENVKPTLIQKRRGFPLALNFILIVALSCTGMKSINMIPENKAAEQNAHIPGFTREILKTGIIKLVSNDALVYIKPVPFYAAAHDPMICWTGSGYAFENISKKKIGGTEVYTGTMKNGKVIIYASWWFDNGRIKTVDQWEWRTKAMSGETDFCLVNVNAESEEELNRQTSILLQLNIFEP